MIKTDLQSDKNQITRAAKIKQIRQCFADQGKPKFNGWSTVEIGKYLESIGLKNQAVSKFSDDEIDLIYADLKKARMI
jgi:hypothetical protein